MRMLILFLALIFTQTIYCQVDTFTVFADTIGLELIEEDTLVEEEEPFFSYENEMPDSIVVHEEDDFETSLEKYTQQIEWDSSYASAYFKRAELLSGNESLERYGKVKCDEVVYQKAKEDFDKAIELRPYNRKYYFQRGLFFYNFLEYEKAREDFNNAYNRSYGNEMKMRALAQRSLANCKLGKSEPCLRDLESALEQDPINIDLLMAKAFAHMILDEHSQVIEYMNKILHLDNENYFAHLNMAFTAIEMGKYEKGISLYNKLITENGGDPLCYGNMGYAKLKLGRIEEALVDINKSLEDFPNNSFALKNRALIYFEMKKNKEACADLQRAKNLGYTIEHGSDLIELLFDKCLEVNQKPKK